MGEEVREMDSTSQMLELIDTDVHLVVQNEMAEIIASKPSIDKRRVYYEKNPSRHAQDVALLAKTEQYIKDGGFGHTTNNFTLNLTQLGFVQKQKLLAEKIVELEAVKIKYGFGKADIVIESDIIPEQTGKNRLQ